MLGGSDSFFCHPWGSSWVGRECRAGEWGCITAHCVHQQKKSPKQPDLPRMSHSPQTSRNRVSTNLTRERKLLLGREADHSWKKLLTDRKENEAYKARPALPASHWGNDRKVSLITSNRPKWSWKIRIVGMEKVRFFFSVCPSKMVVDQQIN